MDVYLINKTYFTAAHCLSTKLLGVALDGGETIYSTGVTPATKIQLNVCKTWQPVFNAESVTVLNIKTKVKTKQFIFFLKLSRPFL